MMLLSACGRVAQQPADSSMASGDSAETTWTVDARGIGPVQVGMSLEQLGAAVGEVVRPAYQINETCDFVTPTVLPKGVSLMVIDDSVARVDVEVPGILTSEGAGVGDSETRLLALYGARARVTPHKYTGPTGHYVIVDTPGDTLHRIIFETDGQKVERYRAGRAPGVDYVEGCA